MLISVAIPCYKASKMIRTVVDEVRDVINAHPEYDYQIILVNDYPFDETFSVIKQLCEEDEKITGLNLSRNYGQSAAKLAAIPYVKGDVLVFMDDDGQHPASGIIPLVEKVKEGYDVVYAYFKSKKHSLFKRVTSKITAKISEFNGTRVKGVHVSSFYAISRFAVDCYEGYKSPFPSLMGYLNGFVGKVTDIEMEHRKRIAGQSSYSLKKLIALWFTGFTNFSVKPIRMISVIGAFFAGIGVLTAVLSVIVKLICSSSMGVALIMALMLFLGGFILIALGFIGEYIGRTYMVLSNLQPYRVREVFKKGLEKE